MVLTIMHKGVKEVWIAHFTHQAPVTVMRLRPYNMKTICTLHRAPCPKKARPCGAHDPLMGVAKCSLLDNFVRWTGRKLSFTRAISSLPREVRKALWQEFFRNEKRPYGVEVASASTSVTVQTPKKEGVVAQA